MLTEQLAVGVLAGRRVRAELPIHGMQRQQGIVPTVGISGIARPAVLARVRHHVRPQGIELNVAHARQQVGFAVYETGFIAAFPQSAAAPIGMVNVAHVFPPQVLHQMRHAML